MRSLSLCANSEPLSTVFRQSVKYQSLVEEHLRHADITSCLCEDLQVSLNSCLELAEQIKREGLQVMDKDINITHTETLSEYQTPAFNKGTGLG